MALEFFMVDDTFSDLLEKFREERFSLQKERGVFVSNPLLLRALRSGII
jgi:hypothetical protein